MSYYKEYEKKLTSPEKAIQIIKNGDCIIHGTTLAEPLALLQAIADRARADDLKNIKIHCFNPQAHAKNGLSIMAFYSTAKDGSISRVVPRLGEGAVVTTPRMDVHYLATEYGIVNLKQKSIRERALSIISIAHPKFREKLLREAEDMNLM